MFSPTVHCSVVIMPRVIVDGWTVVDRWAVLLLGIGSLGCVWRLLVGMTLPRGILISGRRLRVVVAGRLSMFVAIVAWSVLGIVSGGTRGSVIVVLCRRRCCA